MSVNVELRPFSIPEHGLEEIRVTDFKGESKRVGFCPAHSGAAVRFVRIPNDAEQAKAIVDEVARLRTERGLETDVKFSQPPSPNLVRRALKKEKTL